jgi:hypothetical protein
MGLRWIADVRPDRIIAMLVLKHSLSTRNSSPPPCIWGAPWRISDAASGVRDHISDPVQHAASHSSGRELHRRRLTPLTGAPSSVLDERPNVLTVLA